MRVRGSGVSLKIVVNVRRDPDSLWLRMRHTAPLQCLLWGCTSFFSASPADRLPQQMHICKPSTQQDSLASRRDLSAHKTRAPSVNRDRFHRRRPWVSVLSPLSNKRGARQGASTPAHTLPACVALVWPNSAPAVCMGDGRPDIGTMRATVPAQPRLTPLAPLRAPPDARSRAPPAAAPPKPWERSGAVQATPDAPGAPKPWEQAGTSTSTALTATAAAQPSRPWEVRSVALRPPCVHARSPAVKPLQAPTREPRLIAQPPL